MHLLIFLKGPHKIHDAAHVNTLVSAQIPDPDLHPHLHSCVTKYMVPVMPQTMSRPFACRRMPTKIGIAPSATPGTSVTRPTLERRGIQSMQGPTMVTPSPSSLGGMSTPTGMWSPTILTSLQSMLAT